MHEKELLDLRVYNVTIVPKHSEELGSSWLVTFSGFGETEDFVTPTWQSSGQADTLDEAFSKALLYAPTQRQACTARGRSALLPEYGVKKPARRTKSSGPKLSLDQLTDLLGDL